MSPQWHAAQAEALLRDSADLLEKALAEIQDSPTLPAVELAAWLSYTQATLTSAQVHATLATRNQQH